MLAELIIRRFPALKALSEATTGARGTGHLSLAAAQVESEHTEMTRAGRRFSGIAGTTGLANVAAVPTTATIWCIYNADQNRSYIIDSISYIVSSGFPAIGATLIHIVTPL